MDKLHLQMTHRLHPARPWARKASTAATLLLTLFIAACETTGGGGFGGSAEARAERLAISGDHEEAAGIYIGLAADNAGVERDRFTLLAVEQWLDAGDPMRAKNAFRGVARPAAGELNWLWSSNAAALLLFDGEAERARDLLESLSRESLSPDMRLRVQALRADAWFQLDDPTRAIELMLQRESWLGDARRIERNRQRTWQGLLVSDPKVTARRSRSRSRPDCAWLAVAWFVGDSHRAAGNRLGQRHRALARTAPGSPGDVDYRRTAVA